MGKVPYLAVGIMPIEILSVYLKATKRSAEEFLNDQNAIDVNKGFILSKKLKSGISQLNNTKIFF